ncbi:hypothetical protein CALVIDRAFT_567184 [Calocera viscosa TUFC12733]|uniref:DUF6532 domain-containing protein n=1 Tax=Calocera viscosa (strain TUFC12733) TaxID=1330018 RepID=A0A167IJ64_CALVF|nr:hypothetical protein CALVIDRAFT_567184 [Calocera viscosa TUFC12733]
MAVNGVGDAPESREMSAVLTSTSEMTKQTEQENSLHVQRTRVSEETEAAGVFGARVNASAQKRTFPEMNNSSAGTTSEIVLPVQQERPLKRQKLNQDRNLLFNTTNTDASTNVMLSEAEATEDTPSALWNMFVRPNEADCEAMNSIMKDHPLPSSVPVLRRHIPQIYSSMSTLAQGKPALFIETASKLLENDLEELYGSRRDWTSKEISFDRGNLSVKFPKRPGDHNEQVMSQLRKLANATKIVPFPESAPEWSKDGKYSPADSNVLYIRPDKWQGLDHGTALDMFREYKTIIVRQVPDNAVLTFTEKCLAPERDFVSPRPVQAQSALPKTEIDKPPVNSGAMEWQISFRKFFKILRSISTPHPILKFHRSELSATMDFPAMPLLKKLASCTWAWDSSCRDYPDIDWPSGLFRWEEYQTAGVFESLYQELSGLDTAINLRCGRMLYLQYGPEIPQIPAFGKAMKQKSRTVVSRKGVEGGAEQEENVVIKTESQIFQKEVIEPMQELSSDESDQEQELRVLRNQAADVRKLAVENAEEIVPLVWTTLFSLIDLRNVENLDAYTRSVNSTLFKEGIHFALEDARFIYRDFDPMKGVQALARPFQSEILIDVITAIAYMPEGPASRSKSAYLPPPLPLIAISCWAIYHVLCCYRTGKYLKVDFDIDIEAVKSAYDGFLLALDGLNDKDPLSFERMLTSMGSECCARHGINRTPRALKSREPTNFEVGWAGWATNF